MPSGSRELLPTKFTVKGAVPAIVPLAETAGLVPAVEATGGWFTTTAAGQLPERLKRPREE